MGNKKNLLNEKLKEKGLKFTNQRKDIYDFFLKNQDKHMSAEEILSEIEKGNSEIGLATIYRTLQLFTDTGIIVKHDFDDGRSRYELKTDNDVHNHHHLICKNCSKIIEVKEDLLENIENQIQEIYKFNIIDHDVKFYGLCEECRK